MPRIGERMKRIELGEGEGIDGEKDRVKIVKNGKKGEV